MQHRLAIPFRLFVLATFVAVPAASLAGTPAPGQKVLDCNQLVPPALVARVFPAGSMKPSQSDQRTALCNVSIKGNDYAAQASFLCRPTDTLAELRIQAAKTGKPAVAGLGRGASGDYRRVLFYDDDTDCIVEATDSSDGRKAIEFARELAATLKPGLLPAAGGGSLSLACPKLLPETLVKKWTPGATVKARFVQANQMECTLEATPGPVVINYSCQQPVAPGYWADYKKQLAGMKAKDISDAGVGTGGVYSTMSDNPSISFSDRETGCLVVVMALGFDRTRALGLASDVEKALTRESAQ
jgi:hypothetical protein